MVEAAGAVAVAVHGRTAAQAYHGVADWDPHRARGGRRVDPGLRLRRPVEPAQLVDRLRGAPVAGVFVGRGILRNPWLFAQAEDLLAGRPAREVAPQDRKRFLVLEDIDLLVGEVRTGKKKPGAGLGEWSPGSSGWSPGSSEWSPGLFRPGEQQRSPPRPPCVARPLGREQTARAVRLLHEGLRRRFAPPRRRESGPVRGSTAVLD